MGIFVIDYLGEEGETIHRRSSITEIYPVTIPVSVAIVLYKNRNRHLVIHRIITKKIFDILMDEVFVIICIYLVDFGIGSREMCRVRRIHQCYRTVIRAVVSGCVVHIDVCPLEMCLKGER